MKKVIETLKQISTGIKNKFGLRGYSAGNYHVAVIIIKYK